MDDVWLKIDGGQHFERRARQEREPLRIVVVAVQAGTLKVILVVDQVIDHSARFRFKHAAVLSAPCHRHRKTGDKVHLIAQLLRDIVVKRHHNPAADQAAAQSLRQRAGHIAQPAGSGKGQGFTGAI